MSRNQSAFKKLASVVAALALTTYLTPAAAFADPTVDENEASAEQAAPETSALENEAPEEDAAVEANESAADASDAQNPSANTSTADEAAETPDEQAANEQADPEAVAAPTASIGDVTYPTLPDAVKAASAGDTITMLSDVDLSGAGTLDIGGMTLDLAEHTIKAKNFSLIFMGSNATIKNGTFDALGGSYGLFFGDNPPSDQVLIEDINVKGGINIYDATNVVLRNVNADASATGSPYYAVWADVNADVIIESGTYTSNGAAIVGLTTSKEDVPPSTMSIMGGSFFTDKSPLALPGDGRYQPTISGGSFPNHEQAAPHLTDSVTLLPESDGRFTVKPFATTATTSSSTTVPNGCELIVVDPSTDEAQEVSDALADDAVQSAFAKVGGTDSLWTEDVILRDAQTLEEKHDTEMTFTLSYPDAFDSAHYADYDFVVLHLKANADDPSADPTPEVLDSARVVPTADGLQITSTLSPFAIASKMKADVNSATSQNVQESTQPAAEQSTDAPTVATANGAPSTTTPSSTTTVLHSVKEPAAEQAGDPLTSGATTLIEPTPLTIEPRAHVGSDAQSGGQQNAAAAQSVMLWLPILLGVVAILCGSAGIFLVLKRHRQRKHATEAVDAPDA